MSYRLTVTGPGPTTGYDAWKASFIFPPGRDGPLDDPDSDGAQNLIEFVAGSNPTTPGPSGLPGVAVVLGQLIGSPASPAKTYCIFKARVRKARTGITLIPQVGNTPASIAAAGALVGQAGAPVSDPADSAFEFITYY